MKTTITIRKYQTKDNFTYYEATFLNGNLLAYNIKDLFSQLTSVYWFKTSDFFKSVSIN
jgi:hypothetical protein